LLSNNIKIKIYKTIILPFVLYGCETWSLTFRLRRIYGPRRGKITGEQRTLHNEELNDWYSSRNITWVIKSRRMR